MKDLSYEVGDIVELKKEHPCHARSKEFEIVKTGADIKIKCLGCGNLLLLTRDNFNQRLKRIVSKANTK